MFKTVFGEQNKDSDSPLGYMIKNHNCFVVTAEQQRGSLTVTIIISTGFFPFLQYGIAQRITRDLLLK